jgi:hypothetical protein
MDAIGLLLTTAFNHTISEPNIEAGYERFAAITGSEIGFGAFCDAVALAVNNGFIREPVRLPEGALQCHWRLELTSQGVAVVRTMMGSRIHPSTASSGVSCPIGRPLP